MPKKIVKKAIPKRNMKDIAASLNLSTKIVRKYDHYKNETVYVEKTSKKARKSVYDEFKHA